MTVWLDETRRRFEKFPDDIRLAHQSSANHRVPVAASTVCGCFYCCEVFPPTAILDCGDEADDGPGTTALCPKCGIDAVLPDNAGFVLSREFLERMKAHWF
jgi:hypothetical protein